MSKEQNLFRFLSWKVYRDAQRIFLEILKIVRRLPADIRYSLGSQLIRSALSIILNIAEGSGRGTDKELKDFSTLPSAQSTKLLLPWTPCGKQDISAAALSGRCLAV